MSGSEFAWSYQYLNILIKSNEFSLDEYIHKNKETTGELNISERSGNPQVMTKVDQNAHITIYAQTNTEVSQNLTP